MTRIFHEIAKWANIEALGVAMPGPGLPRRVRKIIDAGPIVRISFTRAACIIASCGMLCTAFFAVALTHAQSPTEAFDVISVKPSHAAKSFNLSNFRGINFHGSQPGTLALTNSTVKDLIEYAYDVTPPQLEGSPEWLGTEKFDIDAKMDDAKAVQERSLPRDEETRLMRARVQSLLADRFKLQLHHEKKDMSVFALVVAKDGPKIVEGKGAPDTQSPPPGSFTMSANAGEWKLASNGTPMRTLIGALSSQLEIGGRILVDQTGLTGTYVYKLQWTAQNLSAGAAAPSSDASGPTLFTALQEQLGLRLESTKAPIDVLVVDHVEEPTPN